MLLRSLILTLLAGLATAILSAPVLAADCTGTLDQGEQGCRFKGEQLGSTGPGVAAGSGLEFSGIGRYKDRMVLTRWASTSSSTRRTSNSAASATRR